MNDKQQPSKKIQAAIDLLHRGDYGTSDFITDYLRHGFQLIVQQTVESEVREYLGRNWYEHSVKRAALSDQAILGQPPFDTRLPSKPIYRNGYTTRQIKTPVGCVAIQRPRLRNHLLPSGLLDRMKSLGHRLTQMVIEMYTRGLSTRDIEETLTDIDGRPLLSRSSISQLTESLMAEYEAFRTRDLSTLDIVYLFCDGVYESVRSYTNNQTLLCAWAICSDGRKVLLHIAAVESESTEAWMLFFEEMLARGLRHPLLVTADGGKGAKAAIVRTFPKADRQRCTVHKMRNITVKLPKDKELQKTVHQELSAIYYAPDRTTADHLSAALIERYQKRFPSMIACFLDDLDACLKHLDYPLDHRKYIRSTNLIERVFVEEKRRTKIIPTHPHERAMLKLVYGVLIRVSRKWNRVTISEHALEELRQIRAIKQLEKDRKNRISYQLAA